MINEVIKKNVITVINTWAIPVVTDFFSEVVWNWPEKSGQAQQKFLPFQNSAIDILVPQLHYYIQLTKKEGGG